ncbi:MAG: cytochrome ubiquinol oxidase subunit I [Alphaproteobacteria bacterium]|nr:cytochrome ubiquinol oxidase subunit I [Alphaproteobacteria bacterium]MBU1527273.1 cytochrome ubiquinol oxidase subunit I [Alphaproteobacteria bacterium]MBU2117086.1 cytochrome ubiquinol oxidase subunit I [Alphaproteobacteria bacterium]MBU2350360.1 cytochrome ubiquinol oxidase subunit I [Alphaproteobacteria bacterium]MBU2383512.1 cytochrome ubiquinol oxidase subunit I [Alphaproteobacteria bacterium]
MDVDALLLSRMQFAFTIAFHILFPAFTIGLASFLAVLEGLWLWTKRDVFKTLYLFWIKIFALSFGMGVVSGVVMSYQFGTNWSEFIRLTGGVIGPLLAYEVLTAFFLEASFLGVMLFGWSRVGNKLHFLSTVLVAIGTTISAFWILSANSWMQTPAGFEILPDGRFAATDYWQVIFNPSFPSRLAHMLLAAFLTTALVVGAVSAWHLLKARRKPDHPGVAESRVALVMAIGLLAVVAPLQLVVGHWSGEVAHEHQPSKLAAIEGYWETRPDQPLILFGIPDRRIQDNHFEVAIPGLGNMVQNVPRDEAITGLDAFPVADQPPPVIPFFGFRIMVGLGLLMIALGAWGAWLTLRRRVFETPAFLRFAVAMGPSGFIAVLAGWMVTEVGRQPWVVYGVLRTADAVSPVLASQVATSLTAYVVVYAVVFTAGALFILRLMHEGPVAAVTEPEPRQDRAPGTPLAKAPEDAPGDPS